MHSRAARAASSTQAKRELVRLLFGDKYRMKGPEAHRKLDSATYSYQDLRQAYLERLKQLHPDQNRHQSEGNKKKHFLDLQEAWSRYEEYAKMIRKVSGDKEPTFTMFGVGCSFSDSPEERRLREEITDQACRGWFSSGALSEGINDDGSDDKGVNSKPFSMKKNVSLIDEADFDVHDDRRSAVSDEQANSKRKNLVGHLLPPHKR